ncbi:serine acetyltransferase [Selenomonas sp. TAMA-11512]|uniref:serine O-acetyltransferase n=1 Tax=Selenomonas sp. TAMA-11512 TaxID=3095337 RepID=UPI003087D421|nr:serine acetyltransferase [Selenomonas sp. TAMA-11512]
MARIEQELHGVIDSILADYRKSRTIDRMDLFSRPDKKTVINILEKLIRIIFPGYFKDETYRIYSIENNLTMVMEDVAYLLNKQIVVALKYNKQDEGSETSCEEKAEEIVLAFLREIPTIRAYIELDVHATFEGDPAAANEAEVIYSYPGLYAITVHRLAHALYKLNVPIIPRIMSEYAHSETGVDIHPGATIGKYFFIDHATGVVIGETTVIGEHVKIYQGVTLGALSTRGGQSLRGKRRHPTIEDHVTIYSGASILGGETVIGEGSTIGGNVFITRSVAPGTQISVKNQELRIDQKGKHVKQIDMEEDDSWFYTI